MEIFDNISRTRLCLASKNNTTVVVISLCLRYAYSINSERNYSSATGGGGNANPFGAPEFTHGFQ
jgi:hypothetical protein